MDTDLEDVGLAALEAMEAEDAKEADNTNEDTGETTDVEEPSAEQNDANDEVDKTEEDDTETDADGEEETTPEDKVEEKPEDKKELSDEEFEELAKKRGYSKTPSEEEKAKEEEAKAAQKEFMSRPEEIDEAVWNQLPEANKLIYKSLPYIDAVGADGQTYKVKTADQLPDDFKFASDKAKAKFDNDMVAQELKATKLSEALYARAQRFQEEQANRQEAISVVNQVEALQKAGELPTPKTKSKPGTTEFDNDEAVLLINKVLNYRLERAKEGLNLPVRDAMLLYKAQHPEEFEKKEAKGDIERRQIAKKISGGSKASGTPLNAKAKPEYYRPGMSTQDVLDRILEDME